MKIRITGRHLKITDDIRAYLQKRADKIEARFGPMLEIHVVITAEKHRFETEMSVTANRASFHAESQTHELFAALDGVTDKILSQIRRYKERVKDRRHQLPHRDVVAHLNPPETEALQETEPSTDIPDTAETPRIIEAPEKFAAKPMTVAEAANELHTGGDSLLLFLNAETRQVNLLYQTEGGAYGWVVPLFT